MKKNDNEFDLFWEKCVKFATLRPRSEKELDYWFEKKNIEKVLVQSLKKKLRDFGLLDDREFCEWWITQRMEFRPRSRRGLIYELSQKGIKRELVEEVLKTIDFDEVSLAKKIIEKNSYRWERLGERDKKRKIGEFLSRQGYSWEVIKKVSG